MELICLGSSSHGNGYLLTNGKETLMLEAGINFKEVKEALNYNIKSIDCCLVSHRHGDHSGHLSKVEEAGILVVSPEKDTFKEGITYFIGRWMIMPFAVYHDVPCWGYYIHHPEVGKFIFATDTSSIPYQFNGLNHLMVEANYSEDCIRQSLYDGRVNYRQEIRIRESHMSLEKLILFLKGQNLTEVNNIVLLHLSADNSDAIEFITEVHRATGKRVTVADSGVRINFNAKPF